jgi:hypothetical protein
MKGEGTTIAYRTVAKHHVPSREQLEQFDAFEDIVMIGYPSGVWDNQSGMPVARRGMSAVPLYINYRGKNEILIDIPSYQGSSGSPVFQFNSGVYSNRSGDAFVGGRIAFVGVMYATHIHTAQGQLVQVQIPTGVNVVPQTHVPNNLAICIRADEVWTFEPMFPLPPNG